MEIKVLENYINNCIKTDKKPEFSEFKKVNEGISEDNLYVDYMSEEIFELYVTYKTSSSVLSLNEFSQIQTFNDFVNNIAEAKDDETEDDETEVKDDETEEETEVKDDETEEETETEDDETEVKEDHIQPGTVVKVGDIEGTVQSWSDDEQEYIILVDDGETLKAKDDKISIIKK